MSEAPITEERPATAPSGRPTTTTRAADATWELLRRIHLGTRKPANWLQLFQFAVVGGSGYAINLVVFAALTAGADLHHTPAAIGAFVVAVSNNFALNRVWTFSRQGSRDDHAGFQAARFFAVSLAGLAVNLVVLSALIELLAVAELPAQAVAVAVATPVNFIGNKLWTFDRGRRPR
jgi:dolichol-phosphate mannosyltransferase